MPTLIPPTAQTGWMGENNPHPLFRYYTFSQGVSLAKRGGVWEQLQGIALEDILNTYEEYYLGGHEYPITDAKAAELTAAGLGAYIYPDPSTPVPEDPDGFGEGGFGEGGFGE